MSFPRYPAYKYSGVEWLGEVPDHWALVPIKRVLQSIEQGWSPQCEATTAEPGEWGVLKVGCVNGGKFNAQENKALPAELTPDERLAIRRGDVLVSRANTRELVGSVAIAERDYFNLLLCDKLYRLRVNASLCNPAFLARYLGGASARSMIEMSATGASSSMLNIGQSAISNMPLALPSAAEQEALIRFLDLETAKIDALISEQQLLIELLQEKRQAVISHAVTKGLNPVAPMKNSGVEWLGQIPKHWEVKRMKRVARMESGHTPDRKIEAYWQDCDIPWVSLNDTGYLKDNDYISETAYSINVLGIKNSSARLLPERVVVFSRDATIGRCAITTRPMAVSQHFIAWVCGLEIMPEYLLLRLHSMTSELDRLTAGATLKTIGMPDVKTLVTPLPPLSEQAAIVKRVSDVSKGLDDLLADTSEAVNLLQERRSALISAAVTGQIDVRGLVLVEAAT
jgi:type I restriction enzyme S subunit